MQLAWAVATHQSAYLRPKFLTLVAKQHHYDRHNPLRLLAPSVPRGASKEDQCYEGIVALDKAQS